MYISYVSASDAAVGQREGFLKTSRCACRIKASVLSILSWMMPTTQTPLPLTLAILDVVNPSQCHCTVFGSSESIYC